MTTPSARHAWGLPLGNENFTRAAFNALMQEIDADVPLAVQLVDINDVTPAAATAPLTAFPADGTWVHSATALNGYPFDGTLMTIRRGADRIMQSLIEARTAAAAAAPRLYVRSKQTDADAWQAWTDATASTPLADAAPPAIADAGVVGDSPEAAHENHTHAHHVQMLRRDMPLRQAAGSSASSTSGTLIAEVEAAVGKRLMFIHGVGKAGADGTSSDVTCVVTFTDDTTATLTEFATGMFAPIITDGAGITGTGATLFTKSIRKIRFTTSGTGTATRYAIISAREVAA